MCRAPKRGRGNIWLQSPLQPSWISQKFYLKNITLHLCNHLDSHKNSIWNISHIIINPPSSDPTITFEEEKYETFLATILNPTKTQIWNYDHNFYSSSLGQVFPEVLRQSHDWLENTKHFASHCWRMKYLWKNTARSVTVQQLLFISLAFWENKYICKHMRLPNHIVWLSEILKQNLC